MRINSEWTEESWNALCPKTIALRNTVSRLSHFRLETYGDDNLDDETNVAIVLSVREFIKDSERF